MYQIRKIFLNFLLFLKNFLSVSEKKEKVSNVFISGNRKSIINQAASLDIKTKNDNIQKEVEDIAEKIVKKYLHNTDEMLKFIKTKEISVYRTGLVLNILNYINEKPGFIIPLQGIKGFYLNLAVSLLLDKKLVFKTRSDAMFIFSNKEIDESFLASQIYKFIAFKKNMPGFDFKNQEKFKKLYKNPNEKTYSSLTAEDIFAIQEVISRETEAANFAIRLNQEGLFTKNK